MISVHYFAAARQAAGCSSETVEDVSDLGQLLDALGSKGATEAGMSFPEVLERCTFLVDGAAATRQTSLEGASRVDVLPPFAGG